MEKPPIDPILKKQYEDQIARQASDAAKRSLMKLPEEALMEIPDHQLVKNADREAEQNTADALLNYKTQKWLNNGDEIAAKRSIKEEKERRKYAEENGKNPSTYSGPMFRGTTKQLVGDSSESVFTKFEDYMIKTREQGLIEDTEKAGEEFVNKLPEGAPLPTTEEQEMLRKRPGGLFAPGPFDQDEEHNKVA